MEGERGKLRQSLEELQRLHSQVSTPVLSPVQDVQGLLLPGTPVSPPLHVSLRRALL